MAIDVKALMEKIDNQVFRWNSAKSNGTMVTQETERMKNILLNNVGDIVEALKLAESADERIAKMQVELDFAEDELKDKDDEIKKLRDAAASKPAAKVKPKAKAEPVDVTELPDGKL